jgi:hypothetical protein
VAVDPFVGAALGFEYDNTFFHEIAMPPCIAARNVTSAYHAKRPHFNPSAANPPDASLQPGCHLCPGPPVDLFR